MNGTWSIVLLHMILLSYEDEPFMGNINGTFNRYGKIIMCELFVFVSDSNKKKRFQLQSMQICSVVTIVTNI